MREGGFCSLHFYYDLHLHSCLSPCGSDEMTPANLAAMCALAGLQIVALTDHNTCGNCASFCRAAQLHGLTVLSGMELCTQEEIHVVCLFPDPEQAEGFSREIARHLPPIRNDPTRFGRQLRMDDEDGVLGEESAFLAGSTDIPLAQVPKLVSAWGGAAFPSHIDRPSFSLLGVLGLWDPDLGFTAAELSHHCPPELARRPDLAGLQLLTNSDAHYLDQVWGAEHTLDLPECSPQAVIQRLACHLPGSGQDNFLYNPN